MQRNLEAEFTVICLLSLLGYGHGACTYTAINTDLNTCIAAATTSSTARWFFPHGTIAEQAEICQSSAQTALASCINSVFSACKLEAKSLKMFSTTGNNLVNAYSDLCSATLLIEAQACMSVVSATQTFVTAETAFKSAVTALPDAASATEICGLATTMEYTAYTTLLTPTCTDSTHRAVWNSFFSTILDTYVCTCSDAVTVTISHVVMLLAVLVASYFNMKH